MWQRCPHFQRCFGHFLWCHRSWVICFIVITWRTSGALEKPMVKLTWQWKIHHLDGLFYEERWGASMGYVSLLEGMTLISLNSLIKRLRIRKRSRSPWPGHISLSASAILMLMLYVFFASLISLSRSCFHNRTWSFKYVPSAIVGTYTWTYFLGFSTCGTEIPGQWVRNINKAVDWKENMQTPIRVSKPVVMVQISSNLNCYKIGLEISKEN